MAASITVPTTAPNLANRIRGRARVHIASWVSGDKTTLAATDMAYLGTLEDGVEWTGGPEWADLAAGDDYPAAPEAYLESDSLVATFSLVEVPIENLAVLHGGAATISGSAITAVTNLGEDTSGTAFEIALGGFYTDSNLNFCPTYHQVIIEHPVEGSNTCTGTTGFTHMFKCLLRRTGPIKYTRKGWVSVPVEAKAYWDDTVTVAATVGVAGGATGALGRYHTP